MPFFCDTRFCFRRARFPVDGTLWFCCRKCHPTSPFRSPKIEKIHEEWHEKHPEYEKVSVTGCEITEPEQASDPEPVFGFQLPQKIEADKGNSDIA